MKLDRYSMRTRQNLVLSLALGCSFFVASNLLGEDAKKSGLVPLDLKLPPPAFKGTPKDIQLSAYVEPLSDKPRAPMMVPAGLKNIAPGKIMTSSDKGATGS